MSENDLFDRVVAASGLNEIVAPFTISRLLLRADVQPRELTPASLARALPLMADGIRVYLGEDDTARAVERIRALAEPQGQRQ